MNAESMRFRTLLVDDEPAGRDALRQLAGLETDLEVVGECADGASCVTTLIRGGVDLVLLDIGLPDFSGLEVVRKLGGVRMPAVIFVTAHDEAAIAAFELEALDFLTKPVSRVRFAAAIERFRRRRAAGDQLVTRLERLLARFPVPHAPGILTIRSGNRLMFIREDEVDWIAAEGEYTRVHHQGKSHLLAQSFSATAGSLGEEGFLRIRRGLLVAKSRLREVRLLANGTARVVLADGTELPVSRRQRSALDVLASSGDPSREA